MVGDHIRALKGGRWNHAIDCGDETVIHLAEDGSPPRVRRSYRPEFIAGADAVEVVRHRERTFPANEVVARAYSRIADPGLAGVFRDSGAFAEWCVTGRIPTAAPNRALGIPAASPAPAAARAPATRTRGDSARREEARAAPRAAPRAKERGAKRPGAKAKAKAKAEARARAKAKRAGGGAKRPGAKAKAKGAGGGAKPARKTVRRGGAPRRR